MKKTNHIWIFSDGIKGHETQSLALAKSIKEPYRIFHCGIRQPWLSFAPRILPRFACNILWYGHQVDLRDPPALIITCGRRMAAIGKYYKRQCACKHVQILNPGDKASNYDILIVPEHDGIKASNVINIKGSLHEISSSYLQQVRKKHPGFSQSKPMIGLLIGNPSKNFIEQLSALNKKIQKHYSEHALMVCGSRRTSKELQHTIRKQFKHAKMLWFSDEDGQNPYQKLLAFGTVFFVTADSINMVSETCATNKKVVVLDSEYVSLKHQKFIHSLGSRIAGIADESRQIKALNSLEHVSTNVLSLLSKN